MIKVKKLSDVEMRYIDLNWEENTHEQLAVKLGISVSIVQYYCRGNGYTKPKTKVAGKPPKAKIVRNQGPEKKAIQRPPAIYSNVSSEERVEYWLNVDDPVTAPKRKRIGYNHIKKTA